MLRASLRRSSLLFLLAVLLTLPTSTEAQEPLPSSGLLCNEAEQVREIMDAYDNIAAMNELNAREDGTPCALMRYIGVKGPVVETFTTKDGKGETRQMIVLGLSLDGGVTYMPMPPTTQYAPFLIQETVKPAGVQA